MLTSRIAPATTTLVLGLSLLATSASASPRTTLPNPPATKGAQIAKLFEQVSRSTTWTLVDSVRLQTETWHPEGIVKLGGR